MTDLREVHAFASKWLSKFCKINVDYKELVDHMFADDCELLGFKMDSGNAFKEKYGHAVYDYLALNSVIDEIVDIPLLGSAIYSRWRYFNHWAYDAESILEPDNLRWFIVALSRLEFLSSIKFFEGSLKKIKIESNPCIRDICDKKELETTQRLTINDLGRVWFSAYIFKEGKNVKNRSENFTIDIDEARELLAVIEKAFLEGVHEYMICDVGTCHIELTNYEDEVFEYDIPMCYDISYNGIDVSSAIRHTLNMPDLYAFDGMAQFNVIDSIYISVKNSVDDENFFMPEDSVYYEEICIDRRNESITCTRSSFNGVKAEEKYIIPGGIQLFFDMLDGETLFKTFSGQREESEEHRIIPTYEIIINYPKKETYLIGGKFVKEDLPDDFPRIVEMIKNLISKCGINNSVVLNPDYYNVD